MGNHGKVHEPEAPTLLDGPRGRRLCLELACGSSQALRSAVNRLAFEFPSDEGPVTVAHVKGLLGAAPKPDVSPVDAQLALQRAVDFARYWQEPGPEDDLATQLASALAPFAEAVLQVPELHCGKQTGPTSSGGSAGRGSRRRRPRWPDGPSRPAPRRSGPGVNGRPTRASPSPGRGGRSPPAPP
jgi:hypothetical protein